jgi:ABC-type sugar transport system substrate-binding protein
MARIQGLKTELSRSKRLIILFTLAATMLPAANHPRQRFAWLANDPNNTYDAATLAGIRDVVGVAGATVDPFYAGFDPDTQLVQCHEVIASGLYDGLFVEAADPVAIEPCVAEAKKKHLPVVATDLPIGPDPNTVLPQVPGEIGSIFIPAPHWGSAVQSITPQACQGFNPCNVFYLAGVTTYAFDMDGVQGIQAAAAANSSILLRVVDQAYYDTATAYQVALAQLQAHPEVNVLIAAGDQMALGVEQAAASLGRKLRIVGAGGTAIAAVKAGRWFATFTAVPRTEGQVGAGIMEAYLIDSRIPPMGFDPIVLSGLPDWWTQATLAQYPSFQPQWPGPM